MKTIINDHNMLYSVIPGTTKYLNGETEYIMGQEDDYMIEDYFDRDKLLHCIHYISGINIMILLLSLYQQKYLFRNSVKGSTRYERIKFNIVYFSKQFN